MRGFLNKDLPIIWDLRSGYESTSLPVCMTAPLVAQRTPYFNKTNPTSMVGPPNDEPPTEDIATGELLPFPQLRPGVALRVHVVFKDRRHAVEA